MNQLMKFWYLSQSHAREAEASLHICTGSPSPLLLTYLQFRCRLWLGPQALMDMSAWAFNYCFFFLIIEKYQIVMFWPIYLLVDWTLYHWGSLGRLYLLVDWTLFHWGSLGRLYLLVDWTLYHWGSSDRLYLLVDWTLYHWGSSDRLYLLVDWTLYHWGSSGRLYLLVDWTLYHWGSSGRL